MNYLQKETSMCYQQSMLKDMKSEIIILKDYFSFVSLQSLGQASKLVFVYEKEIEIGMLVGGLQEDSGFHRNTLKLMHGIVLRNDLIN